MIPFYIILFFVFLVLSMAVIFINRIVVNRNIRLIGFISCISVGVVFFIVVSSYQLVYRQFGEGGSRVFWATNFNRAAYVSRLVDRKFIQMNTNELKKYSDLFLNALYTNKNLDNIASLANNISPESLKKFVNIAPSGYFSDRKFIVDKTQFVLVSNIVIVSGTEQVSGVSAHRLSLTLRFIKDKYGCYIEEANFQREN